MLSLRSLLSEPNPNSPANVEAANMYKEDVHNYYLMVKQCVDKSIEDSES